MNPQEREPIMESGPGTERDGETEHAKARHHHDTIPRGGQGVGLGASEDDNTFEPEEDPEATAGQE
jgi:hypothetical protein